MGYMKIPNLYSDQSILSEPEVYVMEKIHGTSAHISYVPGQPLHFFSGGMAHDLFLSIFDIPLLTEQFRRFDNKFTIYGEAYGGKMQGMSDVYGPRARFIAFDSCHADNGGEVWATVPTAAAIADILGIPFVWWTKCENRLPILDGYRDAPSEISRRLGISENGESEGIVIRPLTEKLCPRGKRLIAKHKRPKFRETASIREVKAPDTAKLEARAAAAEYVVDERLNHVLDKLQPKATGMSDVPRVINAMVADIEAEADNVRFSTETRKAISQATAFLYKRRVQTGALISV